MKSCPLNPEIINELHGEYAKTFLPHKYSAPNITHYIDGPVQYPYAVSTCEWCGDIVTKSVSKE